jgi:hypothetical protein
MHLPGDQFSVISFFPANGVIPAKAGIHLEHFYMGKDWT